MASVLVSTLDHQVLSPGAPTLRGSAAVPVARRPLACGGLALLPFGEAIGVLDDQQPLGDNTLHGTCINQRLYCIVMHLVSLHLSQTSKDGFPIMG